MAKKRVEAKAGVLEEVEAAAAVKPRWMTDRAYDRALNERAFAEADAWARAPAGTKYEGIRDKG